MATINTDIAQKIDIVARQHDSLSITLNMSTPEGSVYSLGDTYILLNIYNGQTESSVLMYSNASNTTGDLFDYFVAAGVIMYPNFSTDSYTSVNDTAISLNSDTGIVTISDYNLKLSPGSYKYKLVIQSSTSTKTWMYGNFRVNE
tara:strand:- start:248 stop:682 length:435 start_codon:yes stop_codon:yes gene_type:complete